MNSQAAGRRTPATAPRDSLPRASIAAALAIAILALACTPGVSSLAAELGTCHIVEAVRENGVPMEYVVFANEGHGFVKKENQKGYRKILEFRETYLRGPGLPTTDQATG